MGMDWRKRPFGALYSSRFTRGGMVDERLTQPLDDVLLTNALSVHKQALVFSLDKNRLEQTLTICFENGE